MGRTPPPNTRPYYGPKTPVRRPPTHVGESGKMSHAKISLSKGKGLSANPTYHSLNPSAYRSANLESPSVGGAGSVYTANTKQLSTSTNGHSSHKLASKSTHSNTATATSSNSARRVDSTVANFAQLANQDSQQSSAHHEHSSQSATSKETKRRFNAIDSSGHSQGTFKSPGHNRAGIAHSSLHNLKDVSNVGIHDKVHSSVAHSTQSHNNVPATIHEHPTGAAKLNANNHEQSLQSSLHNHGDKGALHKSLDTNSKGGVAHRSHVSTQTKSGGIHSSIVHSKNIKHGNSANSALTNPASKVISSATSKSISTNAKQYQSPHYASKQTSHISKTESANINMANPTYNNIDGLPSSMAGKKSSFSGKLPTHNQNSPKLSVQHSHVIQASSQSAPSAFNGLSLQGGSVGNSGKASVSQLSHTKTLHKIPSRSQETHGHVKLATKQSNINGAHHKYHSVDGVALSVSGQKQATIVEYKSAGRNSQSKPAGGKERLKSTLSEAGAQVSQIDTEMIRKFEEARIATAQNKSTQQKHSSTPKRKNIIGEVNLRNIMKSQNALRGFGFSISPPIPGTEHSTKTSGNEIYVSRSGNTHHRTITKIPGSLAVSHQGTNTRYNNAAMPLTLPKSGRTTTQSRSRNNNMVSGGNTMTAQDASTKLTTKEQIPLSKSETKVTLKQTGTDMLASSNTQYRSESGGKIGGFKHKSPLKGQQKTAGSGKTLPGVSDIINQSGQSTSNMAMQQGQSVASIRESMGTDSNQLSAQQQHADPYSVAAPVHRQKSLSESSLQTSGTKTSTYGTLSHQQSAPAGSNIHNVGSKQTSISNSDAALPHSVSMEIAATKTAPANIRTATEAKTVIGAFSKSNTLLTNTNTGFKQDSIIQVDIAKHRVTGAGLPSSATISHIEIGKTAAEVYLYTPTKKHISSNKSVGPSSSTTNTKSAINENSVVMDNSLVQKQSNVGLATSNSQSNSAHNIASGLQSIPTKQETVATAPDTISHTKLSKAPTDQLKNQAPVPIVSNGGKTVVTKSRQSPSNSVNSISKIEANTLDRKAGYFYLDSTGKLRSYKGPLLQDNSYPYAQPPVQQTYYQVTQTPWAQANPPSYGKYKKEEDRDDFMKFLRPDV